MKRHTAHSMHFLVTAAALVAMSLFVARPSLLVAQDRPAAAASAQRDARSDATKPPYPPSAVVRQLVFDFKTHRRMAEGSDNWPMTWAGDGHQYTAWGDGGGFGGSNSDGRVKLGVARIEGSPENYKGINVWGGKNAPNPVQFEGKSYGILSVNGVLYMWVAAQPAKHNEKCTIAYSKDLGAHWTLVDWSFTFEDHLSIPTFLNFGRDYAGARDDYVYSYLIHPTWGPGSSPTGNYGFDVHRPGKIYLARAPQRKLLDRKAFEFFKGFDESGEPQWTAALDEKAPVFEDPNGVGWNLSVSYVPALNRYVLCTEHGATHVGKFGAFESPNPWGPWSTMAYDEAWGDGHFEVSAFYWTFPTRWLEPDGRFTMVFTGKNSNDSWNTVQGRFELNEAARSRASYPVPRSPVIETIEWAPANEIVRAAKGGDNWPMTWADDDHLITAYGDGNGFKPFVRRKLSMGFSRIAGGPSDFQGFNIRSPDAETTGDGQRGRKASGMLMVDGVLYVLVRNADNSQLGWSSDRGQTWQWADWKFTTSMGCPTFLNYGKNYSGARDEFVYVYSLDSDSAYEAADRYVLARVDKNRIRERAAYEFLERVDSDNTAKWTSDIDKRGAVFEHPGRCYRSGITYNAGLKRYLWCQVFPESTHSSGPRFQGGFGVFDAPTPWGPWTTAYFTDNWDVGPGETSSFPTKWMSQDGRTVNLVFSGDDHFSVRRAQIVLKQSSTDK